MQVERLDVRAFGCLVDRSFTFAPGLTVVHGSNESGKSTLHEALYAALCGVRRGRGRSAAEHEFDRYRPWDEGIWRVVVLVRLEDGRRVEIVQDLADKGRSRAVDADLGTDLTGEILPRDATPDASIWLGLDRRAFLATACVKQSDLLSVRAEPARLREHLQRAAATSGADATAAEALTRIETFLKEQVGSRAVHSVKPLRRATVRLEEAQAAFATARARHAELEDLLAREDVLVMERDAARRSLELARAADAIREAARLEHDLERARELHRRHPAGPPGILEGHELDRDVERAVTAWDARPPLTPLVGRDARSLREELTSRERELARLQGSTRSLFDGDLRASGSPVPMPPVSRQPRAIGTRAAQLEPASDPDGEASLGAAASRARDVRRLLEEHMRHRPEDPGEAPAGGARVEELRRFAAARSRQEPRVDPALEGKRRAIEEGIERGRRKSHWMAVAAAAALLIGGASLVATFTTGNEAWRTTGGIWLLLAVAATVWWRRVAGELVRGLEALRPLEARLAEARTRHDDWQAEFDAAGAAARGFGIDPARFSEVQGAREAWDAKQARHNAWIEAEGRLRSGQEAADRTLRAALETMGITVTGDPLADADRHAREREITAEMIALEEQVARREREEATLAHNATFERESAAALRNVASRLGLSENDPSAARQALEAWQQRRRHALLEHEAAMREWHELEKLLDGRDLAALEVRAATAAERAQDLSQPFAPHELLEEPSDAAEIARREETWRGAETQLDRLHVEIALRSQSVPAVSEMEESLREAERDVERVQRLEATLESTRDFLRKAQDRAHRDIAPVLAAAVRDALPAITADRYDDVRVDPETLAVQVQERGGEWRDAARLSHGTSEQIHLLLRMAMARHLVCRGETAPLLLDDVTVHFDRERKRAVLDLLHTASNDRQIVLWTQEGDVVEWAERALRPERDALVQLEIPPDR